MELESKHIAPYLHNRLKCHAMGEFIGGTEFDDKPMRKGLELFNLLFKWHFDVFGLIPEKLAIDINTL